MPGVLRGVEPATTSTSGQPPPPSIAQPFIINLNAVEIDDVGSGGLPNAAGAGAAGDSSPSTPPVPEDNVGMGVTSALPSLRALIKPLEGSLPFVLIILTKTLYDHRLGLFVM